MSLPRYTKVGVTPTLRKRKDGIWHPKIQTLYLIVLSPHLTGFKEDFQWWCVSDEVAAEVATRILREENAKIDAKQEISNRIQIIKAEDV